MNEEFDGVGLEYPRETIRNPFPASHSNRPIDFDHDAAAPACLAEAPRRRVARSLRGRVFQKPAPGGRGLPAQATSANSPTSMGRWCQFINQTPKSALRAEENPQCLSPARSAGSEDRSGLGIHGHVEFANITCQVTAQVRQAATSDCPSQLQLSAGEVACVIAATPGSDIGSDPTSLGSHQTPANRYIRHALAFRRLRNHDTRPRG
jgi:hypothetical protein